MSLPSIVEGRAQDILFFQMQMSLWEFLIFPFVLASSHITPQRICW